MQPDSVGGQWKLPISDEKEALHSWMQKKKTLIYLKAGKGTYLSYSRTFIKMCILKDGTSLGGQFKSAMWERDKEWRSWFLLPLFFIILKNAHSLIFLHAQDLYYFLRK